MLQYKYEHLGLLFIIISTASKCLNFGLSINWYWKILGYYIEQFNQTLNVIYEVGSFYEWEMVNCIG